MSVRKLRRHEKDAVLRAARWIAEGEEHYSCSALDNAYKCENGIDNLYRSRENDARADNLVRMYCEFYGKPSDTYWLGVEFTWSKDETLRAEMKHLRVMLLLMFLEVNS